MNLHPYDTLCHDTTRHNKQWNTTLWAQQHYKIKNFSMGNMVIWFPKGKKEHTKKLKKWWFGVTKLEMISSQLDFGSHKLRNMISIRLGRVFSSNFFGNYSSNIAKVNFGLKSINNNFKVEYIGGDSITKSFVIGFIEN